MTPTRHQTVDLKTKQVKIIETNDEGTRELTDEQIAKILKTRLELERSPYYTGTSKPKYEHLPVK